MSSSGLAQKPNSSSTMSNPLDEDEKCVGYACIELLAVKDPKAVRRIRDISLPTLASITDIQHFLIALGGGGGVILLTCRYFILKV